MMDSNLVELVARSICTEYTGNDDAWEMFQPEARAAIAAVLDHLDSEPLVASHADGVGRYTGLKASDVQASFLYTLRAMRKEAGL